MKIDGSDGIVDHGCSLGVSTAVKVVEESSHDDLDDDRESQVTQEEWYLWKELPVDESGDSQQAKDTGSESSYGVGGEDFGVEKVEAGPNQQSSEFLKSDGQLVSVEKKDLSVCLKRKRSCSLSPVTLCSGERPQVGRSCKKSKVVSESGLLVFESSEHVRLRCLLWKEALDKEDDGVKSCCV